MGVHFHFSRWQNKINGHLNIFMLLLLWTDAIEPMVQTQHHQQQQYIKI